MKFGLVYLKGSLIMRRGVNQAVLKSRGFSGHCKKRLVEFNDSNKIGDDNFD